MDDFDPMTILSMFTVSLFYIFRPGDNPCMAADASAANLEKLGNLIIESCRSCCGGPTVDDLPLLVDQKLFKVPLGKSEIGK